MLTNIKSSAQDDSGKSSNTEFYPPAFWPILLSIAGTKLGFHLPFLTRYGFHRDEFLYLALGDHPAFGYWSNPPLIGWISWLTQHTLGDSLFATRLPAVLASCLLVVLAGLMARELGGGRYAQGLAALGIFFSPVYLRAGHMFMPVIFDVLFWTAMTYLLLRYLHRQREVDLLWFGVLFGVGFLNKYNVVFLLLALVPVLLFFPQRGVLWSRATGKAALIASAIILPNMIWQYLHHFPVVSHLGELAQNQLGNVTPFNFIFEQLLFNLPVLLLWLPGLFFLLLAPRMKGFRIAGWLYLGVIALFLLLSGKSYYTMGIYPMLIAAGAVAWEYWAGRTIVRVGIPVGMLVLITPMLPMGVPVLKADKMITYCRWMAEDVGIDAPMRWENGSIYPLPQDYADMHGWQELAGIAAQAFQQLEAGEEAMFYGENYGQAGALDYYGKALGLPPAVSFADSYRLWAPDHTPANVLIYVNDELGEDIAALFAEIQLVGEVQGELARERGTRVYLCRGPVEPFDGLWSERAREVTIGFRR